MPDASRPIQGQNRKPGRLKINSVSEVPMVYTEFGWAYASFDPPSDRALHWVKMPEKHIYTWDGDGWYRISPPEMEIVKYGDLPHG